MSDEWGPWIEHDGSGCPCVGMYVHREYKNPIVNFVGRSDTVISDNFAYDIAEDGDSWRWALGWNHVIRYRIRKPRGMKILQQLVENPPKELIKENA